jgi:hypothetical protein
MKKFKLIKEYPGSVELGAIRSDCDTPILQKYFINYPEFWEEVIEKDYEILISRVVPQEILSVKRLSDGEVFTVGDTVMTEGSRGRHTIRQFRLRHKCIGKDATGTYLYGDLDTIWIDWEEGCGGNWLESTVKLKQQLFISEDGVDIHEGDIYYIVDTDFSIHMMKALKGCGQYSERKYFSTLEAAEDYAIKHSRVLSIEDFWEFVCWGGSNITKSKRLKRLVKERLNLE